MKTYSTIILLVLFAIQITFGQTWHQYPVPVLGNVTYFEFYKDSMLLIQNRDNQCFVTFDKGQSWIKAMNGFADGDTPEYITLGRDLNYYALIRDNVYRYSIENNYWIWLFGGYEFGGFEVDNEGNIFGAIGILKPKTYVMEYYWSKVGNPDFYPEKLIVLDNEKIVSINQSLGLLTFIDKDGGLSEPIKIVKNKTYIHYSEYYQNLYFHDQKNLFILNVNTFQLDSVPLLFSYKELSIKMFENYKKEILISAIWLNDRQIHENFFSSNGGFNLIPLKDSIINNNKTIEYIHFFHDNSFLISNYGYTLTTTDTGYKVNINPADGIYPYTFLKTEDAEYYFYPDSYYNGIILSKSLGELEANILKIDNKILFDKIVKDKDGTVYIFRAQNESYYYKLKNMSNWVKINLPTLNYPMRKFVVDNNGILYASDSSEIKYSFDKGLTWNKLIDISDTQTDYTITSNDSLIYFAYGYTLKIVDLKSSTILTYPLSGFIDINNQKILNYVYTSGLVKGSYEYFISDSLQAKPRSIYQTSKNAKYRRLNNSFWLFNSDGILNILNSRYNYRLPNTSGNIVVRDITLDPEGYLYIINDDGVFKTTFKVKDVSTATLDYNILGEIKVSPNPTKSSINVEAKEKIKRIDIFSSEAKVLIHKVVNSNTFNVDVSNLTTGIYFIRCTSDKGAMKTEKFLKSE